MTTDHNLAPYGSGQTLAAGVRRMAGLPQDGGAVSAEQARRAGRKLAQHPALGGRSSNGHEVVPDIIRDAADLLQALDVRLEILRSRDGFAVVKVPAPEHPEDEGLPRCPLCKGLLEAIPEAAGNDKVTLVETACVERGDGACLYSLAWRRRALHLPPARAPKSPGSAFSRLSRQTRRLGGQPEPATTTVEPDAERSADDAVEADEDTTGTDEDTMDDGPGLSPDAAESPGGGDIEGVEAPDTDQDAPHADALLVARPSRHLQTSLEVVPVPRPGPDEAPIPFVGAGPSTRRARRRRAPWLLRRGWMLALAMVAGATGGWFTGAHHATSYSAQATLEVQTGAGTAGLGNANNAVALATTYAAVVPTDGQLLRAAGRRLKLDEPTVAKRVSASVETGTSVLLVTYTAPTAEEAVRGAHVVSTTMASSPAVAATIPTGSVQVVHLPTSATVADTLKKYGLPIGGILGLLVGLIIVMAAERADPRVDDAAALSSLSRCPASTVPGDVTDAELGRAVGLRSQPNQDVTLVPLTSSQDAPSAVLVSRLRAHWPPEAPSTTVTMVPAMDSGRPELAHGNGPTVLVVASGTAQRSVAAAVERLVLLGRAPIWAVLTQLTRRQRRATRAR